MVPPPPGLLLRFFLRKPLAALARGMDRIAEGYFDRAVRHLSYTELTVIAMRFEQMASRIKDREQVLMAMNHELQHIDGLETYRRVPALVPDQKAIVASGFAENERVETRLSVDPVIPSPKKNAGNTGRSRFRSRHRW